MTEKGQPVRVLLLCGNRFAMQTMQELLFSNLLAGVAIPAHCDEWLEHAQHLLQGVPVPILALRRDTYAAELAEAFAVYGANLGLMASFSYKIPEAIYRLPAYGFFNIHPGALPAYRGPDPVFAQIRARERWAEVTLHEVDAGWDTGAVVLRERIVLLPTDTHGMLSARLAEVAARSTRSLIKLIGFGLPLPRKVQDESKAVYHRRQTASDVSIRWEEQTADEIVALIHACNPWNKGATTRIGGRIVRLVEASAAPMGTAAAPGTVAGFDEHAMWVACKEGGLIAVSIASVDEGILRASRLQELGVAAGQRFEDF